MKIERENSSQKPQDEILKPGVIAKLNKQRKYFKAKRFVDEYIIDLDIHRAWERCGFITGNTRVDNAEANRAYNRPDVQQMIKEKMEERAARTEITQEAVLKELALIGFQNIKDIANWDGNHFILKPFNELTREQTAVISEIEVKPGMYGIGLKFKTYDKKSALVDVGRHLGMFWEGNKNIDEGEMARKIAAMGREIESTYGKPPNVK